MALVLVNLSMQTERNPLMRPPRTEPGSVLDGDASIESFVQL